MTCQPGPKGPGTCPDFSPALKARDNVLPQRGRVGSLVSHFQCWCHRCHFPQAFARGARCDLGWHVSAFQANANSCPLITRLPLIVALPAIPQVGLEISVELSGLNLLDKLRLRSPTRKICIMIRTSPWVYFWTGNCRLTAPVRSTRHARRHTAEPAKRDKVCFIG